jgi:selenide,water dikinase
LDQVLSALPRVANPDVLVGFDTADDAGVYRLTDDLALVQTVDFFTPIVDDPYTFGGIAAANSLSDVYAMGGHPISALSIVAWPGGADPLVLGQILRGGLDKMTEASCSIIGGHSVNDPEIKFGYAVTGTIHPRRVKANAGARAGDVLVLTKAIGTGVIGTALKRGIASEESVAAATASMLRLNRAACEAMLQYDSAGCTDITGFGLLGHARELAVASGVTIEIEAAAAPLLPGAMDAAKAGAIPAGLKNNMDFIACAVAEPEGLDEALRYLLYDPQTSGGLLIPVAAPDADALTAAIPGAKQIGRVVPRAEKPIRVI